EGFERELTVALELSDERSRKVGGLILAVHPATIPERITTPLASDSLRNRRDAVPGSSSRPNVDRRPSDGLFTERPPFRRSSDLSGRGTRAERSALPRARRGAPASPP